MCNQFTLPTYSLLKKYLQTELALPLIDYEQDFSSHDIFPGQTAPVLLYDHEKLQLVDKTWGYPSPVDAKKLLFNARIERFYEAKPSLWDHSFKRQRCLIVCQSFYEYGPERIKKANGRYYRQQYQFYNEHEPLTLVAGIYDQDRFSMVTTAPNKTMAPIHQRMPLVIEPNELRRWLFQNFTSLIDRSQIQLTATKVTSK